MRDRVTGMSGHSPPAHVWVNLTGRATDSSPGVFLGWRQSKGRWQGLVVYAEGGGNHEWKLHQSWLDASLIQLRR